MAVRAKFRSYAVKHTLQQDGSVYSVDVTLGAVTGGSEENKAFWKSTPSGQITLTITNPDAYAQFLPGMEFYVDFTEVQVAPSAA